MKSILLKISLLLLITSTSDLCAQQIPKEKEDQSTKVQSGTWTAENGRFIRQTETTTTTTQKPKKPRPSNIFSLFSVLLTETRDDASRAFNEIGTLFNGQFANSSTTTIPKNPHTTTSTTTTTTPSSSTSENDEDNEITTTTEAFRITRDEFLGILRSNVQGIRNLFGKEFRVAIRDSNQNVREFGRDLGNALYPYFSNNNTNRSN